MLRLKTNGEVRSGRAARKTGQFAAVTASSGSGFAGGGPAAEHAGRADAHRYRHRRSRADADATAKIAAAAPVTYDNKYEIYGGINFMNFQAGQHLPKRMNLGGGELLGTYWLSTKFLRDLGRAEYRGEAGTTPVFAKPNGFRTIDSRPLVYMNMGMVGAQYRGPKNQYAALNYHGLCRRVARDVRLHARRTAGSADWSQVTGLYSNRTKPMVALGGSVDFNLYEELGDTGFRRI